MNSTILLLTGLATASAIVVGLAAPIFAQLSVSPQRPQSAQQCQQLADFNQSPIQMLPKPFEKGCAFYTPLRANHAGTIVYVLKTGLRSPITPSGSGELTTQQAETLNRLVEKGQALRITWFVPGTIGAHQWLRSIPEEVVFIAWNDLCMKFPSRQVGCVESGAFRPSALAEILVRNQERLRPKTPS